MMFLGGSGVNTSNPSMPCWETTKTFYMGPKANPMGLDHSLGKPKVPLVVNMYLTAYLDTEAAYIDYEHKMVSFPRLGRKLEFKEEEDVVHFSNSETGLTFLKIPREINDGYFVIKSNVTGTLFTDVTNADHPDILTLSFYQKSLALQMYKLFVFQNKTDCYSTQLEGV